MRHEIHNALEFTPDVSSLAFLSGAILDTKIQSTKDYVRNYKRIMQNKPNLPEGKNDAKCVFTKDYENKWQRRVRKNKPNTNPKQTQTNPISEKPKMNLNFYSTKDYDNKPRLRAPGKQTQNKPNSNPISPPPKSPPLPITHGRN